jgi:hypothetical protein
VVAQQGGQVKTRIITFWYVIEFFKHESSKGGQVKARRKDTKKRHFGCKYYFNFY